MDGNVFSNSLDALGKWLLGGAAQGNDAAAQQGQGQSSLAYPTSTFAPPQGGAVAIPNPQSGSAAPGGQPQQPQQPRVVGGQAGGGGAGNTIDLGTLDTSAPVGAMDLSGYSGGGGQTVGDVMGGGGGAGQAGGAIGSALSGISSALSKAGSTIAGVNTMPTPIQSGPFPSINQYTPTLIGRRTNQSIYG